MQTVEIPPSKPARIVPHNKAKGTDFCGQSSYQYIIRSDLGCYLKAYHLRDGDDPVTIHPLHPTCAWGDHYMATKKHFYIIKGSKCRRVTDLSTGAEPKIFDLERDVLGDFYMAKDPQSLFVIKKKEDPGGQQPPAGGQQPPAGGQQPPAGGQQPPAGGQQPPAGGQQLPAGGQQPPAGGQQPPAGGQQLPAGGQQPPAGNQPGSPFNCMQFVFEKTKSEMTNNNTQMSDRYLPTCDMEGWYYWATAGYFYFLKPMNDWNLEYHRTPDLNLEEKWYKPWSWAKDVDFPVYPPITAFLPGGLAVIMGSTFGRWEQLLSIQGSNVGDKVDFTIKRKQGYKKPIVNPVQHKWNISQSEMSTGFTTEDIFKAALKQTFYFPAEYGGLAVDANKEDWSDVTEVEESLSVIIPSTRHAYIWQYVLGIGDQVVLYTKHVKKTKNESEPQNADADRPQNAGERQEPDADRPQNAGERQEPDADRPQNAGERQEPDADRPQNAGERQEPDADRPQNAGERQEPDADRPQNAGERQEPDADRPQNAGERQEPDADRPQNASERQEPDADRPQNIEEHRKRMLVPLPRTKFSDEHKCFVTLLHHESNRPSKNCIT